MLGGGHTFHFTITGPRVDLDYKAFPQSGTVRVGSVAMDSTIVVTGLVTSYRLESATKRALRHVGAIIRQVDPDWEATEVHAERAYDDIEL